MDFRIRMAQQQLNLSRPEAIGHIEKMDQHRRKWTRNLYGVNWEDPSLYDFVINLEHVSVEEACEIVGAMVELPCFAFTAGREAAVNDLALASRVRAELALDPFTANLEVEVEAQNGAVEITGEVFQQQEDVERVAGAVAGVVSLNVRDLAPADEAWPWSSFGPSR